jgi:ATP-dependent protease ClpP protease subunit
MYEDVAVVTEYERRKLRENRIVMLSGEIDDGTAHSVVEDFHMIMANGGKDPITLIISSGGGNVFSGLAIMRAIRLAQRTGIKVIGQVHGHACSMAFFILQCCDERVIGGYCVLMAHGITTGFTGDIKNLDSERKLLDHWHEKFAAMVAARCKPETKYSEPSFWYEILRDNTPQWYQSDESLEMGLVDRIEE